jgi:hypothetical protein
MAWRVARSLDQLLAEINASAPNRSRASDGSIGDAAHQTTDSDHNPHCQGWVVTARDFTHDPAGGFDAHAFADWLRRRCKGEILRDGAREIRCLAPGTRILGADLNWHHVEDLRVGDELVAFDEWGQRARHWSSLPRTDSRRTRRANHAARTLSGQRGRTATVTSSGRSVKPCVEVQTDWGLVTCSTDHLWVVRDLPEDGHAGFFSWVQAGELREGDCIKVAAPPWEPEASFDAGWLAGMFDGEGCLSSQAITRDSKKWNLSVSQKSGPVLDRVCTVMSTLKIGYGLYRNDPIYHVRVLGSLPTLLSVLGRLRPTRLLSKAVNGRIWDGVSTACWPTVRVHRVRDVGMREVVALGTSSSTLIAEGMLSHNCKYLISNRRIVSPGSGWEWQPYSGSNPHDHHVHVSVDCTPEGGYMDSTQPWGWPMRGWAVQVSDTDAQYMTPRVEALAQMLPAVRYGPEAGKEVKLVTAVQRLERMVTDLTTRPAATVTLTAEDRAAIVADIKSSILPALRAVVDEELDEAFRAGADAD